jgi:hypothetical protein
MTISIEFSDLKGKLLKKPVKLVSGLYKDTTNKHK